MTGTIRDTNGGIELGQAVRDGRGIASRAGRSMLRMGVCICVLVLAGSLFAGVAAADPVEISDWTELQGMEDDLDADYVLVADLDENMGDYPGIGDDFQPIGFNGEFTGSFNGNGHTISNLVIDQSDSEETPVGLFGHVGGDGKINNVALVNANVTGDEGQTVFDEEDRTGALVGLLEGTITNSSADAIVVGGNRIGGLVGVNDGGDVSESYATGALEGSFYAGGLIGWNSGDVSTSYATSEVTSSRHVGGLVGWNSGTVSASYATGDVNAGFNIGGLVGWNDGGTVSESYATGDVGGAGYVGGLVGWNDGGTVSASYSTGDVGARDFAAGLVGWNDGGTVSESYATGETSSRFRWDGGLVARNSGTVSASYWDTETTGQSTSAGSDAAYGLTTAEMTGVNATVTMAGFDFYETWVPSTSYPEFAWDSEFDWSANFVDDTGALALEGEGTEANPYVVTNVYELQAINADLSAYYVLDGYVDASVTEGWNGGKGFEPIGNNDNHFEGMFNGSEYTISNLTITSDEDYVGLFGAVGDDGTLTNVSLEAVDITGNERVGGLVGQNEGSISHSYVTGSVDGSGNSVGGLVGLNGGTGTTDSTISHSYSAVSVDSSSFWVGGLVGQNAFNGEITESYANGTVTSPLNNDVGGLVGVNGGEVSTSYATGSATGSFSVGGLIGRNTGTVEQSYASGSVEGSSSLGGLIGTNTTDGEVRDSYWDIETTGQTESDGGTGLTTLQITGDRAVDNLFDFGSTWEAGQDGNSEDGRTVFYPVLQNVTHEPAPKSSLFDGGNGTGTAPYLVSTWYQLDYLRLSSDSAVVSDDAHFELTADLDADTFGYEAVAGPTASDDDGFDPIGDFSDRFSGHFDGSEHTISNLTIMRGGENYVGLFGYVGTDGELTRVSLEAIDIEANSRVGGLAGQSEGTISHSHVTGSVEGAFAVGGLVGQNSGTITRSYATVDTSGSIEFVGGFVGGLVGWNDDGTITESYATGSVDSSGDRGFVGGLVGYNSDDGAIGKSYATGTTNGSSFVGGLVGASEQAIIEESYATGSVESTGNNVGGLVGSVFDDTTTNSYWDIETTGQNESANGTGLTTEQMTGFSPETTMEPLTSSDFSITDGYPLLDWSIDDLTLTLAATDLDEGDTTDATVSLSVVDDRSIPASETADYTTGDDSVATVDQGTVTGVGVGSTTITATVAAVSDDLSLSVTSAPSPSAGGGGGGGGGGAPPAPSGTTVTVDDGSASDSTADDDSSDSSDASDASRPDTRISVTSPQPGQRLVIEGSNAFISSGEDDGEPAPSGDDGAGDDGTTDGSDDTDDGSSNVRSDRLSVDLNTDRDFELSVTTYETDLRRSLIRGSGQPQQSVDPLFASGASVPTTASTSPEIVAPEAVSAAAATFENEAQSVSAGYLNVEHTLEPEEIAGATFEFSIRQSYLDELGVDADGVTLYHQVDGEWEPRETEQTDADDTHYRFEGTMESFSVFALGTEAAPIGVTEASLSDESVETGETTTVSATVENRGQHRAEHTLELTADGEIVATKIVSLDGGGIAETTLSFEPPEGEYAIAVSGTEAGILTVGDGELTQSWLWLLIGLVVLIMAVLWRRSQQANNEKSNQQ